MRHIAINFLAFVLLLTACKKNNPGGNVPPAQKLKYLTQVIAVNGSTTTTTNYTYDDKNRLISMKNGVDTYNFTYNGNDLFSWEFLSTFNNSNTKSVYEYNYADNQLQTITHKLYATNGSIGFQDVTGFYFRDGKLAEEHQADGTISYFYYENNNLTKIQSSLSVFTYTYDDKNSMFLNLPKTVKTAALILRKIEYFSQNNIIGKAGSSTTPTSTTYIYDAEGYPTSATTGSTKYTYVYKEL